MARKEIIIISVGGSIIVPDKIDLKFLKALRKLIKSYLKKYKFVLITGGGKTARDYINTADNIAGINDEDLDWLGIHATRLNGQLLRTIFQDVAYPRVLKNPTEKVRFDKVLVAAGWQPGYSTDYDAVVIAKTLKAKTVINMTNIDYLHDKDPRKYKTAKKILNIDWKGFRKIVGNKWSPGLNAPFDPIASKLAQKENMKLILIGKDLKNLKNFLDKKSFKGSVVEG